MSDLFNSDIDRRTLAKGAAWSLPVVAGAVAAPLAQASPPPCPGCLKAGVLSLPSLAAVDVFNNKGDIDFAGLFGLDSRGCDLNIFQALYYITVTTATLTMRNTLTGVETGYAGGGLATGTGTFGQLGALPGAISFANVTFPNGFYLFNSGPVRPKSIQVTATVTLISIVGLIQVKCPVTLSWDLTEMWAVGSVTPPWGGGLITWTGLPTAL